MKAELAQNKKIKPMHWIMFGGLLGLISTLIVIVATFYQNKSSSAKSDSIKATGESTNQRVASLELQNKQLLKDNLELQNKNDTLQTKVDYLRDRNEELNLKVLKANELSLNYMTGHDSYFIITLSINNEGQAQVYLSHKGEYPITDAYIKIANTTLFDNGTKQYRGSLERWGVDPPNFDQRDPHILYVPKLHVGENEHLAGVIPCKKSGLCTFMINVTASSGTWYERLLIWPNIPAPYPYRHSYKILKIDPENPKSNRLQPNTLKIIEQTSLPEVIPNKNTYDWFGQNIFQ